MGEINEIEAKMRRAKKAIQAAELLCDEQLLEDSLRRRYYAILHAARAALLPKRHVSNMEIGQRAIGKTVAKRLAEVFGVSVGKFI